MTVYLRRASATSGGGPKWTKHKSPGSPAGEQTIDGVGKQSPAAEGQVRITICPDPAGGRAYALDSLTRTASLGSRDIAGIAVGGGDTFAVPLGPARFLVFGRDDRLRRRIGLGNETIDEESLGRGRIEGLEVTGRRITTTIAAGQWNNDRPMQIVEERWESPELKIVIYSRQTNPQTGNIEYRLTNIRRTEPPPDLFVLPADSTIGRATGDDGWITLKYGDPLRKN